jgi:hypothetical protein
MSLQQLLHLEDNVSEISEVTLQSSPCSWKDSLLKDFENLNLKDWSFGRTDTHAVLHD